MTLCVSDVCLQYYPLGLCADAAMTTDYWRKQWYPIALAAITDRVNPVPFTLLGNNIVIWWDGTQWRCVDDTCPHRSVSPSHTKLRDS